MKFQRRSSLCLCLLASLAGSAQAAGLQWYYQNASGLGNAYSGEAAIADDASTEYFNPAGLSRFKHQQIVAGIVGSRYSNRFNGTTVNTPNPAGLSVGPNFTQSGTAFSRALVPWPFFYYVRPLSHRFSLGFGISSPFGIGANFPTSSIVRYNGTRFCFADIDFSLSLAYQISKAFSGGLGLDINRLAITHNVNVQTTTPGQEGTDSHSLNTAYDWGHGWHGGLLYQMRPGTRFGLAYHSKVVLHPHGHSEFVVNPGVNPTNEIISNDFKFTYYLPASTALSAYHELNGKWAILGTLDYTQWSTQRVVSLRNYTVNAGSTNADLVTYNIYNGYKNTFRLALGTDYKLNHKWLLRGGLAFEQDPSNPADRSANDPGSGSTSIAIGAHYQLRKAIGIDMGYQHFFMRSTTINLVNSVNTTSQSGSGRLHQDSLGIQGTWDLC